MKTQPTVIVTIPVYKPQPSASERLSLQQASQVLGHYPIVIFCPFDLDVSVYKLLCPNASIQRFDNQYFEGIKGYNKLMFSPSFYRTFWDFDYLLIYQLDAYVFRDDLQLWCNKGYDYVGGPWLVPPPLTKKPIINLSKCFVNRVGNGGLSLRKTKSHWRNVLIFKPLLGLFLKNEDMFWGLALYFLNPFFKRPSAQEALAFAFELVPQQAFEQNNRQLPFGVHAWEKYDAEFWRNFIKIPLYDTRE